MALDLEDVWSHAHVACLISWNSPSYNTARILISEVLAARFLRELPEHEQAAYQELANLIVQPGNITNKNDLETLF